MAVLPNSQIEILQFFEAHVPVWALAPTSLGLSASQVAALGALTSAARTAYNSMQSQHQAAKASTGTWYDAHDLMRNMGADLIKVIKAYAAATNNPGVYNSAQIPAPKSPTPTPAPATPLGLAAALANDGAIELTWNASIANGTTFGVWRKLAGQADFSQIGLASSATSYIDNTLPVGGGTGGGPDSSGGVWYQVRAHRLGLESNFSEPIFVRFGRVVENGGGGGGGEELKIAA